MTGGEPLVKHVSFSEYALSARFVALEQARAKAAPLQGFIASIPLPLQNATDYGLTTLRPPSLPHLSRPLSSSP